MSWNFDFFTVSFVFLFYFLLLFPLSCISSFLFLYYLVLVSSSFLKLFNKKYTNKKKSLGYSARTWGRVAAEPCSVTFLLDMYGFPLEMHKSLSLACDFLLSKGMKYLECDDL